MPYFTANHGLVLLKSFHCFWRLNFSVLMSYLFPYSPTVICVLAQNTTLLLNSSSNDNKISLYFGRHYLQYCYIHFESQKLFKVIIFQRAKEVINENNRLSLHVSVTQYGINYAGMQITRWDFQNKGTLPVRLSFVLKVPLRYLRPDIIYSAPDRAKGQQEREREKKKINRTFWKKKLFKSDIKMFSSVYERSIDCDL